MPVSSLNITLYAQFFFIFHEFFGLNLNAEEVPLLVGEMVSKEQGGKCAGMNEILAKLPKKIPNAHIISSEGCEAVDDGLHFSTAGYRELGKRYGEKFLKRD